MKDLSDYLVEKLKLSDVNVRRPEWVDANSLYKAQLKDGYILETIHGVRYIMVPIDFFTKFERVSPKNYKKNNHVFVRLQGPEIDKYMNFVYLVPSDYQLFPLMIGNAEFNMARVFTREKEYKKKEELVEDLIKINEF